MSHYRSYFFVLLVLAFSSTIFAQSSDCPGCKQADVNFTELANYYKNHPQPLTQKIPFDEDEKEGRKEHRHAPASEIHMYQPLAPAAYSDEHHVPLLPMTAAPADSFLSTVSDGSAIPPDTHGAVDSQYCVTAINTAIHIQDRVGGNVSIVGLDGFWSSVLPAGTGAFDPKVFYDAVSRHWILVTDAVSSAMTNSTILLGVSATNDPTGVWHLFSVAVDPSGASWLDFPNLGFNQKWVAVTGNMFPNSFSGASGAVVYIFDYANLKAGTLVTPTKISQSSSFSICAAVTHDVNEPNLYCLETWSGNNGQLNLWRISGAVGSPTMTHIGYPASSQHWRTRGSGGDFGPQLGSSHKIDIGDDRITRIEQRNGKLWTSFTAFLPSSGTVNRSSIMWWQVDTLANPLQVGLVDDPSATYFYAYPSMAVNMNEDALIGFGVLSGTMHPSAGYAMRLHTDPADSIRPVDVYRHGAGTYYTTFGGSNNRWGDYSGACIDPRNDQDFWTIQESSTAGTSANWDTWWANIQLCPKPHAPVLTAAVPQVCPGDTLTFNIRSIPGATSYNWIVTGAGWSGSSTDTTITVIAGSTAGTLVAYATNACGQGESLTFTVPLLVTPPRPTIYTVTPPCSGVSTAVFSATSSGATTYTWQVIGSGWSGTGSGGSFTATVGTGAATVICYGSDACFTGPTDTITIVPGTPSATFTESTHDTTVGSGMVITYTGGAPAGATYTWNFSGGIATPGTGAGPQTVYWNAPGTYNVLLTVGYNGCDSAFHDTVHVDANVGVPVVKNNSGKIRIMPNPSDGVFDIVLGKAIQSSMHVKVLDMQGRVVYVNDYAPVGSNKVTVATSNLADGVYVVSINLDGEAITQTITINK